MGNRRKFRSILDELKSRLCNRLRQSSLHRSLVEWHLRSTNTCDVAIEVLNEQRPRHLRRYSRTGDVAERRIQSGCGAWYRNGVGSCAGHCPDCPWQWRGSSAAGKPFSPPVDTQRSLAKRRFTLARRRRKHGFEESPAGLGFALFA